MLMRMGAMAATGYGVETLDTRLNVSGYHVSNSGIMPSEEVGRVDSMAEEKNAARKTQQAIIKSIDESADGPSTLTKGQKGNYGEMKMDDILEGKGLERKSLNRVTDIDAPTHQGIDGVYYDAGPPPRYIIAEAKYGTAKLSTLSDGTKQMSDKWIDDRLLDAIGEDAYNQYLIDKAVYPECRTDVLIHVNTDYIVDVPKILVDGKTVK